jgi:hypothetical protein
MIATSAHDPFSRAALVASGIFLIVEAVTQGAYLTAALLVFSASCFFHGFALWSKHQKKRRNGI